MSRSAKTLRRPLTGPKDDQTAILRDIVNGDNNWTRTRFRWPVNQQLDETFMLGCAMGQSDQCALRDMWRVSLPTVFLPLDECAKLVDQDQPVFEGRLADLSEGN